MGSTSPLTKEKRGREKNLFFGSISKICFAAGDGAQRCRGTGLKRALNLIWAVLLPAATYNIFQKKTKVHSIPLVPVDDGLVT